MVSMLMMVIKKPIDVLIVKAVPFDSGGAECATNVENCGESVVTEIPHTNIIVRKKIKDNWNKKGDSRQQIKEIASALKAIFLFVKYCER